MAGGVAADIRTPYPKGRDGLVLIQSAPVDVQASKTGHVFDQIELQFACQVVKAETVSSVMAISNGITFIVQDDTGTPKKMVNAGAAAAITDGSSARTAFLAATLNKGTTINAGALLEFQYTSGASDTSTNTIVRLWVKPVF